MIDELLTEAARMPLHGFIALVREWEALVDADGSHKDHDAAHERRKVRVWRRDDQAGGELWGSFGADQFAEIAEILDRYADAELDADRDNAGEDGAVPPDASSMSGAGGGCSPARRETQPCCRRSSTRRMGDVCGPAAVWSTSLV
ncbi:MAG: hypothetical protein ACK5OX_02225 [Desertimonas sp.]